METKDGRNGTLTLPTVRQIEYSPSQGYLPPGYIVQFNVPLEGDSAGIVLDALAVTQPNLLVNFVLSGRDRITVVGTVNDQHTHEHQPEDDSSGDSTPQPSKGDELLNKLAATLQPTVKLTGVGNYAQSHFDFEAQFMVLNYGGEAQHVEALDEIVTKLHGVDGILAADTVRGVVIVKAHGKFKEKEDWLIRTLIEAVDVHVTFIDPRYSNRVFLAM